MAAVATKIETVARAAIPPAANGPAAPAPAAIGPGLLRFITCGSVDDGKSTLIGRLMYEAGVVPDDQIAALQRDSEKFGAASGAIDYSLLVDGLSAEREQGITIDVAYRYFATPRRSFIVADTPGHEQYTRNMATGASTADVAIILIDARKGVLPQTRRHSFIVSLMGVRHIIVAVNKMDLIAYDQAAFDRIETEYRAIVGSLGFRSISVTPVSAREGDNITQRSSRTPWHRGAALLPLLEEIDAAHGEIAETNFILPVQWVNRPSLDFRGYAGTLARGALDVGADVIALPSGRRSKIARIVTADGDISTAQAGQSITVTLTDEIDVSRGDALASPTRRPHIRKAIAARLLWTSATPLTPNREYVVRLASATAAAKVDVLHSALDIENFSTKAAATLAMNDIGVARLSFDRPLVVTDFADNADLGGFILIDRMSNETAAFGFVISDESAARAGVHAEISALVNRALGQPGSDRRRRRAQELSWRIISATLVGAIAYWATDSSALAWTLGIADLVLRPALRRANAIAWKRALQRAPAADLSENGGGI